MIAEGTGTFLTLGLALIVTASIAIFATLAWSCAALLNRTRVPRRESEARRAAILEAALDCIITIDHEGRVVEFNPAAEATFGYGATRRLEGNWPVLSFHRLGATGAGRG